MKNNLTLIIKHESCIYVTRLILRYKRFLARMKVMGYYNEDHKFISIKPYIETVYVANTGSMKDMCIFGSLCLCKEYTGKFNLKWIAIESEYNEFRTDNNQEFIQDFINEEEIKYLPKGKEQFMYRDIYETKLDQNICWIGVDTSVPNRIFKHILGSHAKQEVKCGNSRFDFKIDNKFAEIKNVHWRIKDTAYFPDCISKRASKQLNSLLLEQEYNKATIDLYYCVQRADIHKFAIAQFIDPTYVTMLDKCQHLIDNKYAYFFHIDHTGYYLSHHITL